MIQLDNLTFRFGSTLILNHLHARLPAGSFCAIAGANGSGKTTLLRCISGLLQPQEGCVRIAGRPVADYAPRQLARQVSLVRQHPVTDVDFTAFEIVLMGRNPYQSRLQNESQADRDIVRACMEQTETWHLRAARPATLSGGELQRVMIARALAQQTPVMLLDEPTSNLDIAHQFEIMELLQAVTLSEGKTVLIVMHDLNLALQYCRQLLLLHEGRLLFEGPTAEGLTPERIATVYGIQASLEQHGSRPHLLFSRLPRG